MNYKSTFLKWERLESIYLFLKFYFKMKSVGDQKKEHRNTWSEKTFENAIETRLQ